jgi:hypothetical protein
LLEERVHSVLAVISGLCLTLASQALDLGLWILYSTIVD